VRVVLRLAGWLRAMVRLALAGPLPVMVRLPLAGRLPLMVRWGWMLVVPPWRVRMLGVVELMLVLVVPLRRANCGSWAW
jgi:hypothetical protein